MDAQNNEKEGAIEYPEFKRWYEKVVQFELIID
jgi:hypothetical protein